jgi:hypothetical protein
LTNDQLQEMGFRFRKHDRVYLLGSVEPLVVLGQMFITMASGSEERRYYLKSRLGDELWIEECHVYAIPTREGMYE